MLPAVPPVDPLAGTGAKFKSLREAIDAIPLDHTHAILFDGTASQADGADVKVTYLEKLGGGWQFAAVADYSGQHGASGEVELGKSW